MPFRVQCDPSLHLRMNNLILHSHQIFLRCVFKHTLLGHSTGKKAKSLSCGTLLHTSPTDLLTCFLLRGANHFSQQHNPILSCVSAADGNIGSPASSQKGTSSRKSTMKAYTKCNSQNISRICWKIIFKK